MKVCFFIFIATSFLYLQTAAQTYSWAQGYTATGGGAGIALAIHDSNDNIYSLGGFTGTIDVDQSANTYSLTSIGQNNIFLLKQDASGHFIWAKHFSLKSSAQFGFGFVGTGSIALDANQNIYIAGIFSDTADFDPGPGTYYMGPPSGIAVNYSTYLVKLFSNGEFAWAKQFTSPPGTSVSLRSMAIQNATTLYLGLATNGIVDVDPGPGIVNMSGGIYVKIDTSGSFVWAGSGYMVGLGMAVAPSGSLVTTGSFSGTLDADPGPGVYTISANGNNDIYIIKLDSLLNLEWAKAVGGGGDDRGRDIYFDAYGNTYTTGHFEGTVDFDPGPGVYSLTSPARSVFTLKLNNNGDFKWATMTGTMGNNEGRAIATDSLGNVYTASLLDGPADLDPGPGNYLVTAGVGIQKLDSSGNFVWGAGVDGDIPGWIGLDHEQSVYCTGSFSGPNKDFDPGSDTYLLSGSGQVSGFILKLCQQVDTVSLTANTTTACIGDTILLNAPVVAGATYRWYRNNTLMPDTAATLAATASGTYRVRIGGGSCPSFGINNLTFNPVFAPTISLPAAPMSVAAGQQVNLLSTVVNGGSGYVIDWYRNGVLLTTTTTTYTSYTKGAGTDTILAVVRYPTPNSCFVDDTSGVLLVSETLGVEALSQPIISLYPNPTMGFFTITAAEPIEQIDIRDVRGKLVYEASPQRLQASINLSAQGSGVYFYRLKVGDGWVRGKVVVR